jgi:hypothetical protein
MTKLTQCPADKVSAQAGLHFELRSCVLLQAVGYPANPAIRFLQSGRTAQRTQREEKRPMTPRLLKPGTIIRHGSLIGIAGVIAAWEAGSKRGVSLWPDAVRVTPLRGLRDD